MSSCLGFRKSRADDQRPLLPKYEDDTSRQRQLHQKLHTYQMFRALGQGYMPSNEQAVVNLRTILAADLLNPDNPDLSDSGRLLVKYTKAWLHHFIELLQNKNGEDQIQDLLWYLSKSRVSVDTDDIASRASTAKSKADAAAAYESIRTVGSLLLTNSDFRLFLSDLSIVGREVFKDTALAVSEVAEDAAKKAEPSKQDQETVRDPGADGPAAPTQEQLQEGVAEVSQALTNGASKVAREAEQSIADKATGPERDALLHRLKQAVLKLRKRNDYSDSASVLSKLIKRYSAAYSRGVVETLDVARDDVEVNPEVSRAMKNGWLVLESFGEHDQWRQLQAQFDRVLSHKDNDPQFEDLMQEVSGAVQDLLTDPSFFDDPERRFEKLREKSRGVGGDQESSLRTDVDRLLEQGHRTLRSVLQDRDVSRLLDTSAKIFAVLSPKNQYANSDLLRDAANVFVPLAIKGVQYIPVPRVEVSTPAVDLLLETLILEPGRTVNNSSFLPFRLRVETFNALELRKPRLRATPATSTTSLVTIKLDGLSLRASELGYWLRARLGWFPLSSSGIASFALDDRGIDLHLDVEVHRNQPQAMLTLRSVRVQIHKLDYALRRSSFSPLAWLLKPLVRAVLRKALERQLASAVADLLRAANAELVFARERLRATRVADPRDLLTFLRAVAARMTPAEDPDVYSRVGVAAPRKGVFRGVYAPGSLVKVWEEEAARAGERVEDGGEVRGWRNDIFDVGVGPF